LAGGREGFISGEARCFSSGKGEGFGMRRIFQVAAWFLTIAIIVLSLVPASSRPVTGTGQGVEHLSIFVLTGFTFGLGYPRRPYVLIAALVGFAAAIEVAQLLASGRHARMSDFFIDGFASCVGVGLSRLAGKFWSVLMAR
jgi:hypothetical protein